MTFPFSPSLFFSISIALSKDALLASLVEEEHNQQEEGQA